jgi:hypothetical protein
MSLQDIGSIGELIGALATVATLAYLALQIRQNTNATRAATHHAVLTDWRQQQRESYATHHDNVEIWARGLTDFHALPPPDQRVFFFLGASEAHFIEDLIHQRAFGNVPDDLFESWMGYFVSVVRTPGGAVWWSTNKALFTPSVVAEVDRRAAASGDAPHLLQIIPQFVVRNGGSHALPQ